MAILLYTASISVLAFWLAFSRRNQTVAYYCGRKAAFASSFSTYVYATAIAGYVLGLLLNVTTFVTLWKMYSDRTQIKEIKRQLRILRYVVLISLISTIAVVVPNLFSLFTIFYGRVLLFITHQ